MNKWRNIFAISAGLTYTVALRSDGTVLATGKNEDGQCNVSGWEDIVAIAASYCHTVGLKADGTVVTAGNHYDGEYKTRDWSDIVYIATGHNGTAGIKKDGTVVATDKYELSAEDMMNVVTISCSSSRICGLTADGTGVHCSPKCEGMVALCAVDDGGYISVREDGTVFSPDAKYRNPYGRLNVQNWTDIKNPGKVH